MPRRGFQGDHYDIPEELRGDAVAAGAQEVAGRELLRRLQACGLRLTPAQHQQISDLFVRVHAAWPHLGIDPVVAGAHLTTALHSLVSREAGPGDPAVITVGSLVAGTVGNVIPDTATLLGTVRTFRPATRDHLERRVAEMAHGVASTFRCTADVAYARGTPPVINDAGAVDLARLAVTKVAGASAWASPANDGPTMGAEDWAFILERVPGCMFVLGVRDPAWEAPRPIHSPRFIRRRRE